jgi:glycosyltransferase involved in cell wall biosynthesis
MMGRVQGLISTLNEEQTIARVVSGLSPHVASIAAVDDGSTDRTAVVARAAGAEVIVNRDHGQGTAIRVGRRRVLERDRTHVLLMDGDMQHLPEEAPRLTAEAERSGADVVLGERRFDRSEMPASRYHANRIGSLALSRSSAWPCGTRSAGSGCSRLTRSALCRPRPAGTTWKPRCS